MDDALTIDGRAQFINTGPYVLRQPQKFGKPGCLVTPTCAEAQNLGKLLIWAVFLLQQLAIGSEKMG